MSKRQQATGLEGDALDRELASLKQTIGLCNPIFQGHVNDWKSTTMATEEMSTKEKEILADPPKPASKGRKTRVDERALLRADPIAKDADIATSTSSCLLKEVNGTPLDKTSRVVVPKPIPKAKRLHMHGILHGLPIPSEYKLSTTTKDAFGYDAEMKVLNRDKDMSHFRKRDTYSEYVEARARFSKMHSVT
ncbi:hypothetical protein SPRG_07394 [Saprolegnia parasitica CBS 223.65]|uniref:Uncharacterized protein n=1 Tax=Saprolegnia parasitica (strain CBS 223.65) TaxID=695850 RepID=A0A067CF53_SAPPC|nr:hypothetical protein SPRG_07394 [Saprolegnia parasitica CBS 223.65]KDO27795.1 hypothetical protein SPRG_07394 [Saprolegnia parasitica CBS 223.65]|eukprot:XP_012201570.1 hypothetical protein SPRG_07394 [Saprolegnia parasitica CBS 223.65]